MANKAPSDVAAVVKIQVAYDDTVNSMFSSIEKRFSEIEKKYKDSPLGAIIQEAQRNVSNLRDEMTEALKTTVRAEDYNKFSATMTSNFQKITDELENIKQKTGEEIPESVKLGVKTAKQEFEKMTGSFKQLLSAAKGVYELGSFEFRAAKTSNIEYTAEQVKEIYEILTAINNETGRTNVLNKYMASGETADQIFTQLTKDFNALSKEADKAFDSAELDVIYLKMKELHTIMGQMTNLDPFNLEEAYAELTNSLSSETVRAMNAAQRRASEIAKVSVRDTRAQIEAFNLSEDGTIKVFAKLDSFAKDDLINQLSPVLNAVQEFANEKLIKVGISYNKAQKAEKAVAKPESVSDEVIKSVAKRVTAIEVGLNIPQASIDTVQNQIKNIDVSGLQNKINTLFDQLPIETWSNKFSESIAKLSEEVSKFSENLRALGTIQIKPVFEASEGQKASINELFNESTVGVLTNMRGILEKIADVGSDLGKTQIGTTLNSLSGFLSAAQGDATKGATDFLNSFGVLKDTNPAKAFIDSLNTLSNSAGLSESVKLINSLSNAFSYAGGGGESNRMTEFVNSINEFNGNESINTFFDKFKAASDSLTTSGFTNAITELRGLFTVSHGDTINADSLNTFISAAKDFKGDTGLGEVIGKIETAANSITDGSPIKTVFDAISNFATTVNGVDIGGTGITDFVKALLGGTLADGVSEAFTSVSGVVDAIGKNTGLHGVLSSLLQFEGREDNGGDKSRMETLKDSLNGIVPSAGAESFIDSLTRLLTTASSNDPQAALTALLNFASGTQGTGNGRTRAVNFQAVRDFLEALWLVFAEFNGSDTHIDESRTETLRNFLRAFTEFSGEIGGAATRMSSFVNAITNLAHATLTITDDSLKRFGTLVERLGELQQIAYRNTGNIGLTGFVNAIQELGIASSNINPSDDFSKFLTDIRPILSVNATNATAENLNAIVRTVQSMHELNVALRDNLHVRETQGETGDNVFVRFEHFITDLERITNSFSGIRRSTNLESITSFITGVAGPAQTFTNAENFERFVNTIIQLAPAFSGITIDDAAITSLSNGLSRIVEFANEATRYAAFVSIMGALERILPHVANMNGESHFSVFAVGIGQIVRVAQDLRDADGFNRFTTFIQTLVGTANTVINVDSFNIMVRTVISLFAVARQLNDKVSENLYKGAVALEEYATASNSLRSTNEFLKLVASLRLLIEAAQWITNVDEFVTLGVGINQIAEASQKITNPDVLSMLLRSLEGLILLTGLTSDPKNLNNLVYVFEGFTRAANDTDPTKISDLVKALGELVYASEFMSDDGTSLKGVLTAIQTLAGAGEDLKGLRNVGNILDPIKNLITASYDLGNTDKLNQFVQTIGELVQISKNTQNTQVFVNLITAIKDFKFDQAQSAGLEQFNTGFTKIANVLIQKKYDPQILVRTANAINQFAPKSNLGDQLTKIGEGLGVIVQNTQNISPAFNQFAEQLNKILQYGDALTHLANIMQKPKKQLEQVQRMLSNTSTMNVNVPAMEEQIQQFEVITNASESYKNTVEGLRLAWNKFKNDYDGGNNVPNDRMVQAKAELKFIKDTITSIHAMNNKYGGLEDLGFDSRAINASIQALKNSGDQTDTYRQKLDALEKKVQSVKNTYGEFTHFTDKDRDKVKTAIQEINALIKQLETGKYSGAKIDGMKLIDIDAVDQAIARFGSLKNQTEEFSNILNTLREKVGTFKELTADGLVDKGNEEQVKTLNREITGLLKSLEKNQAYVASAKGIQTTITSVEELRSAIFKLEPSAKSIDIVNDKTNKVTATFKNARGQIEKLTYSIKDVNKGFVLVSRTVSGNSLERLRDTLEGIGKNFMYYFSGRMLFYRAVSGVRSGIEVVKELNTQLTEMRKVSDDSLSTLNKYVNTSFEMAKAVGSTSTAILSSTADYMRLGKSLAEASELAKDTAVLLNVSEFEDVSSATDALISMTQAYQELTSKEIIDRLNYAGNNFSISTSDLAKSLQKSAGTLKIAGNEFNEAIALTTAGNAILQDPSKVAAGLRTIALRITGTKAAKEELEELGEDVDDFVMTTSSKLNDMVRGLTKTAKSTDGISLLTDAGNYRSTYEILQDIADVWDDIKAEDALTGENRQNALLELLAGKNRSNVLASILEDAELLRKVFEDVTKNSSGSAIKELNKYMDSIEGKLKVLTTQAQEFWNTIISSEVVKGVVSVLSKILELINSILKLTPGAIWPYIVGIANLFLSSHGVDFIGAIGELITKIPVAQKLLANLPVTFLFTSRAADAAAVSIDNVQAQLVTMGEGGIDALGRNIKSLNSGVTTFISTLGVMLKNLAIIAAVALTVYGVSKAISDNIVTIDEYNQSIEETENALKGVEEEYSKLTEKSKLETLTTSEKLRTKELEAQKKLLEEQLALEKKRKVEAMFEDGFFAGFDKNTFEGRAKELVDPINNAWKQINNATKSPYPVNMADVFSYAYAETEESAIGLALAIQEINSYISEGYLSGAKLDIANKRLNQFTETLVKFLRIAKQNAILQGVYDINGFIKDNATLIHTLAYDTEKGTLEVDKFKVVFQDLYDEALTAGLSWADIVNLVEGSISEEADVVAKRFEDLADATTDFSEALEKLKENIDAAKKKLDSLREAQEKLKDKELTADDVLELIKDFPDLASSVDWGSKTFGGLGEAISKQITKENDIIVKSLEERKEQLEDALDPSSITPEMRTAYATYTKLRDKAVALGGNLADNYFVNESGVWKEHGDGSKGLIASEQMKETARAVMDAQDAYKEFKITVDGTAEDEAKVVNHLTKATEGYQQELDLVNATLEYFKNDHTDAFTEAKEDYDKVSEKVNSLSSAIEKLLSGSLTSQEVLELMREIPELLAFDDIDLDDPLGFGNLYQHLVDLIDLSPQSLIEELKEVRESVPDEETKGKLDAFIESLERMRKVPSQIDTLKSKYDDVASDISTINGAIEKLLSGEMVKSDVQELLEEFEELRLFDDIDLEDKIGFGNLYNHLIELSNYYPQKLINTFKNLRDSLPTEKDKAKLDFFIESLERMMGKSSQKDSLKTAYDSTVEGLEAINEAIGKLITKDLKKSDVVELLMRFEKLREFDDIDLEDETGFGNLYQHLMDLSNSYPTTLVDRFKKIRDSLPNEGDRDIIDLLVDSLQEMDNTATRVESLKTVYDSVTEDISTLDSAIEKLLSKEMTDTDVLELLNEFKELRDFEDIDLNDKVDFGNLLQRLMELRNARPTKLIQELQTLRDEIADTAKPEVLTQLDTLITALQRAVTFDENGADAYTQAITDAFNRTNSTVQSTLAYYEDLATLQEAVADGFVLDAEKAWELAQMFPELSKGIMEYGVAGDGLVELNQEIVEGLLEGGDTAIDATIKQLESEKALLQGKRDAAQAELELAENVLTAKDRAQRNQALTELERYQEVANKKIKAEQTIDEEVAKSDQDQIDNHGFVAQMVGKVASFISENMGQAAQDASSSVSDSSDKMQLSLGNIVDAAKGAWAAIKSIGSDTFSGFKNFVGGAGGSKIFDRVKGWFGGLGNAFGEGVETLKTKISEFRQIVLDNSRIEGLVADLKIELSNYDDAIAAIDGQITTLKNLQGNVAERIKRSGDDDGSGGSDGSDGSDAAAEQFSETIDWIERAIEMVEKAVSRLGKTAGNVYAIFSRRNRALLSEIEKVKEEIALQQAAYETYLAVAESIDLSEEYKTKVQQGLLQIEIIENEELSEKINLYKEWYFSCPYAQKCA